MTYTANYGLGPGGTPRAVQTLIWITCLASIFCALVNNLFVFYLHMNGPQQLFSLSWTGLTSWYIWEPLTYFFLQSAGNQGLSLFLIIELVFNMYILWIMGSYILERVGEAPFVRFYFLSGILTGLTTLLLMPLIGQYAFLAGPTPIILAIMIIWSMIHPESELLLFFLIPVKAKWIAAGILALTFLINLSNFDFVSLVFYFSGIFIGYLYAVLAWGLASPFPFTHSFDEKLARLGEKVRHLKSTRQESKSVVDRKAKVFDLFTGKAVLNDDQFMDAMLEKISKYGDNSLSWSERNRMKKISERKARRR